MNEYKLKDLIDIKNGTKYSHLNEGNIPVYGSGGIMCFVDDFLFDGEAVLLPRKGTLNNIMFTSGKIWTVDTMYYALVNEKANPYYLYSYLQLLDLSHLDSGSALPSMTKSAYNELPIRLPEIGVQNKIAKVLSDLDAKIELNNKINAEIEAMAKLIYDYWFVQFDFPDENGKPYKSSGGLMVYNEELKREIPEGWEVGGFADIGTIIGGTTPSKSDSSNFTEYGDGTPWITPKDLSNNTGKKYVTRGEMDVTEKGIKSGSLKVMPAGTILLTSRAPIGYIAIARIGTTTNQGFKSIVPNSVFSSEYLYYTVQLYVDAMKQYASGSTFQEISGSVLKTIRIPIPPNSLVKLFTLKIESIFKEQDNREIQNEKLAELRDWLLPMLMNGQVKVN